MKQYNNEKAVISLTSWKARIDYVSTTICSLLKHCPKFHTVLVLSEEEFPTKENELPNDINLLINNDLIEILWVKPNYKSYKKVLFTIDKYRNVPIISADDDCIYNCNYAEILYNTWLYHKDSIITNDGISSNVWGSVVSKRTKHVIYLYTYVHVDTPIHVAMGI